MLTAAGVTATDGCYYLRGGLFGELLFPVKKFHSLTFFTAVKFTAVAKIEKYFENLSLSRNDFLPKYAQHLQQGNRLPEQRCLSEKQDE